MPDFTRDEKEFRLAKLALRKRLLTARRELSEAALRSAATSIQESTLTLLERRKPTVCAAYVPIGTEPGGADLVRLLAERCTVLLPVLEPDGDLDWAAYDGAPRPSARGLLEPAGPRLGREAVTRAGVVLVPALAVSRAGVRLGRGGGSYDRVLARITDAVTVALLHDGELLDDVPAEAHDQRVDAVVTPADGLSALPGWTK